MRNKTKDELVFDALKRDYRRLAAKAARASALIDEYMEIGREMIAIRKEAFELGRNSIMVTASRRRKLKELSRREIRVNRVSKMKLTKLLDAQFLAERERDTLGHEIELLKFRMAMKSETIR